METCDKTVTWFLNLLKRWLKKKIEEQSKENTNKSYTFKPCNYILSVTNPPESMQLHYPVSDINICIMVNFQYMVAISSQPIRSIFHPY